MAAGERERTQRETEYIVWFTDEDAETYDYKPATLDSFCTFNVGAQRTLKVGLAHGVEALSALEAGR